MTSPNENVKSVNEFLARVHELEGAMMLYRGLSNSNWELEASIYRRIKESLKNKAISSAAFQYYVGKLLRDHKNLELVI